MIIIEYIKYLLKKRRIINEIRRQVSVCIWYGAPYWSVASDLCKRWKRVKKNKFVSTWK